MTLYQLPVFLYEIRNKRLAKRMLPIVRTRNRRISGCIILSLMMFATVRFIEKQYVWKWILGAFVLLLLVIMIIGIAVSMATGLSFDQGFFAACCGVMGASGAQNGSFHF